MQDWGKTVLYQKSCLVLISPRSLNFVNFGIDVFLPPQLLDVGNENLVSKCGAEGYTPLHFAVSFPVFNCLFEKRTSSCVARAPIYCAEWRQFEAHFEP